MLKTVLPALGLVLGLGFAPSAPAQCDCEPFTTVSWPSGASSGTVMLRADGSEPRYRVELSPNRQDGDVVSATLSVRRGEGPNLLMAPGEAMPRHDFQAADCLGDPPAGGLYGRQRDFAVANVLIVATLEACEATPDGETVSPQILSLRVGVEIRPLPQGAN